MFKISGEKLALVALHLEQSFAERSELIRRLGLC
jgi:hypothetical protein